MIEICHLSDLNDGEAKGFNVEGGPISQRLIIIRQGSKIKAYINLCPHIGSRLDSQAGHFFNEEKPDLLFCDSTPHIFGLRMDYVLRDRAGVKGFFPHQSFSMVIE